jgi:glycosyltransferase involved in cell wall biosynthesis
MTRPEVSCVIPAYESPDLFARCIQSICMQRDVRTEVIVSDDSRTNRIADHLRGLGRERIPIRRLEGPKSGNPVENWNAGLGVAEAKLSLLVHHDEWLTDPFYLRRAVDAMHSPSVAAAVGGVAVTAVNRPSRFALASRLVGRLPGARALLPAVNWIGPTAAFAFRTGWRFDPTLMQLVDVEFYGRVLATGQVVRLSGTSVGSLGHHDAQISARIDTVAEARRELAQLASRNPPGVSPLALAACRLALCARRG